MIDPRLSQALKLIAEVVADQEQAEPAPVADDQQFLKLDQLAARMQSHPQSIRALMAEGLPYMRMGRVFRFDLKKVQAWLSARALARVETKPVTPKPEPRADLGLGDDVAENPFADFE